MCDNLCCKKIITFCYFQQLSPHFSCCGEKVDGGDVVILHYCCLVFAWCPTMANWTCAELQLHIHCIGVPWCGGSHLKFLLSNLSVTWRQKNTLFLNSKNAQNRLAFLRRPALPDKNELGRTLGHRTHLCENRDAQWSCFSTNNPSTF